MMVFVVNGRFVAGSRKSGVLAAADASTLSTARRLRTSATGQTINALLPVGIRTDIEDGACYNETFCDVEAVSVIL